MRRHASLDVNSIVSSVRQPAKHGMSVIHHPVTAEKREKRGGRERGKGARTVLKKLDCVAQQDGPPGLRRSLFAEHRQKVGRRPGQIAVGPPLVELGEAHGEHQPMLKDRRRRRPSGGVQREVVEGGCDVGDELREVRGTYYDEAQVNDWDLRVR